MNQTWIDLAPWAAPAAAWMLTYLLHSTVLLVAAAATALVLGERRAALQEVVWKCALVGGIATATLQAGLGWTPVAGTWELPGAGRIAEATSDENPRQGGIVGEVAAGESAGTIGGAGDSASTSSWAAGSSRVSGQPAPGGVFAAPEGGSARAAALLGTDSVAPSASAAASPTTSPLAAAWPLLAVLAWLALAAFFAARLAGDYLRLAARLRERWPVADGAVAALFGRLLGKSGRRRPVGLTGSERLPVPIAWGLARPEVSLPARVLRDLSPYHQESILAHELAHVLRRDPAWLAAARLIEAVLFFQPLNRLARRRLQELAEYRCDDRAVELTGRPIELARCLTEVAAWRLAGLAALPVPSMASGSALGRRVRRLVHGERGERLPRWVRPAAVVGVLAVALAAPAVSGGRPAPAQPADEAAAAPAPAGRLDDSAIDEEENAGWVLDDGRTRRWDELTPEEREEVRRQVAAARDQARLATEEAHAAMAELRARLRAEHRELRSAERQARLAGAHGEAAEAARRAHREALAEARRTLETTRRELREIHRERLDTVRGRHRDSERQRRDEMRREHRERYRHLRQEIERQREEPRRDGGQAALSAEEAARMRAEALAAAQAGLAAARHSLPPADVARQVSLAFSGLGETLPALIGGSVRLGLGAAGAALSAVDLSTVDADVARALAEVQRSMPEIQAQVARALAAAEDDPERQAELRQAMAELEAEMPRIQAEIAAAMAEVERELAAEMPKVEAELAAAMAELEAERPRIEAEIAAAMAELDREWPAMEAELAAAMAELEREMPRIEAELAQAMAELEAEMPRIEAEMAAALAEVEAEWPEIEAELERAMAELERELAAFEAEIEAEEAAGEEELETEEIDPDAPSPR
ncbi:MAG TPA: M56 family metallopeptidase [Thermoanaerobaculia bacterium]